VGGDVADDAVVPIGNAHPQHQKRRSILTKTDVPWNSFDPLILIGIGALVLVRTPTLREG
jgi:hypothetical protein